MLNVRLLIWDTWNVPHIARHQVIPEEVEQVCHGQPVTNETYKGRIRVVGTTNEGKILTVILAPEEEQGIYYVITARTADRRERNNYHQQRGAEQP